MTDYYSIVILPDDNASILIKNQKESLYKRTKFFKSSNSVAHITLVQFHATSEQIRYIEKRFDVYSKNKMKFKVFFDKFICSTKNGCAFYLPAKEFKKSLCEVRKSVKEFVRGNDIISCNPHISLGRELTLQQLQIAKNSYSDVTFECEIGQIALRKFNPTIGQFTIENKFSFGGERSGGTQLSFWS